MKQILVCVVVLAVLGGLGLFAQNPSKPVSIEEAIQQDQERDAFMDLAGVYGLTCYLGCEQGATYDLMGRADKNPTLRQALRKASRTGVNIHASEWTWFTAGNVGPGSVEINTRHSDEKIIAFLTE